MKPSDNPRDVPIATLHAQGRSIRSIAHEVGLSRSRVHEIVTGLTTADDGDPNLWDDGEEGDGLALLDATEEPEPVPPFTSVGIDEGVRSAGLALCRRGRAGRVAPADGWAAELQRDRAAADGQHQHLDSPA